MGRRHHARRHPARGRARLLRQARQGRSSARDALRRARRAAPLRCLVLDDPRSVALGNEPVRIGGEIVGRVTTGGYGYTVERSIAYAWVPAERRRRRRAVEVDIFGEWVARRGRAPSRSTTRPENAFASVGGMSARAIRLPRRRQALRPRHRGRRARPRGARRARASACSGPTAPASRRRCGCSPRRRSPTRASSRCSATSCRASRRRRAREMGVVPQLDNLDTTLTVEQNLLVFAHLYRVPRAERHGGDRARAADREPRATGATRKVDELSGGMRRRLLIARALVHRAAARAARRADGRPRPAGAPGAVGADRPRCAPRATSILMSTHYIEEAERLADTVTSCRTARRSPSGGRRARRRARRPRGARGLRRRRRGCARSRPRRASAGWPTRRTGTCVTILRAEALDGERARGRAARRRTSRTCSSCSPARRSPDGCRAPRPTPSRARRLDAPGADRRARARGRQLRVLLAVERRSRRPSSRRSTCWRSASASARSSSKVNGLDYVQFVGTGTVATAVLFSSVFPAMFGTFVKYQFQRTYDAILAAPVDTEELVTAEALWIAARAGVYGCVPAARRDGVRAGPGVGHAARAVHRVPQPASAGRASGSSSPRSMKSIDNFSYVTSTRHHAAVPGRRHVLPDLRPAGVGAGRWRTSTRCTTASSSCATPCSASQAESTSGTSAFLLVFGS